MRPLLVILLAAAPALAWPAARSLSVTATVQRSLQVRTTGPQAQAAPGGSGGGRATAGVLARVPPADAAEASPPAAVAEVLVVLPDGAPAGLRFNRTRR